MLKNLDPILTGELLVLLDELEPGQWLAVIAGTAPVPGISEEQLVIDLGEHSLEAVTQAVLSVLPLDTRMTPILFLDNGHSLPDAAFAVSGLACDAERRRVPMDVCDAEEFRATALEAAAVLRTAASGEPAAFLLRKGALGAA
jgi:L-fucose mutarotase/ribose pyranase (RbsD/FucU family)